MDDNTAKRSGSLIQCLWCYFTKNSNNTVTTVITGMIIAALMFKLLKISIIMVVPSAEQATLQKLLPIKIAVINCDGSSINRSTVSVCFGLSFSNCRFNRIRLMAVKAVSDEENIPDNIKKKKKAKTLYVLMSNHVSYKKIIHPWAINKNTK